MSPVPRSSEKFSELTRLGFKNPIILALDVDSEEEAIGFAKRLREFVGGYKVGPRLLLKYGPRVVNELKSIGPVFIDNKYFDIPSTMISAVRASFDLGATLCTVHSLAGSAVQFQLAALENELNLIRPFKILNVTLLTSFSTATLPFGIDRNLSMLDLVSGLVSQTSIAGLTGVVCSASEVKNLRMLHPSGFFVTPGIRAANAIADDQNRVETAQAAIQNGANALVIGRPIIESSNPESTVREMLQDISFS